MNGLTETTPFNFNNQNAVDQHSYLMSLLGHLPAWHRIIFNMHVIDGIPLNEIAYRFNISVTSCSFDLAEARNFLKDSMTKQESLFPFVDQVLSAAK